MVIRVSPTEPQPTHHIKLSSGGVDVGLILTDGQGRANSRSFQRSSYPRSALKIYQGDATYSDTEPPFTPISQIDWGNGRGQENFDKDSAAFYDSQFAYTVRDQVTLGGMEVITPLYTDTYGYWPHEYSGGAVTWHHLTLTGSTRYIASKFTAKSTTAVGRVDFVARRVGNPGVLTYLICADSGGSPNLGTSSVLGSGTLAATDVDEFTLNRIGRTATFSAFASGVDYWLVVYGNSSDDASNYWQLLTHNLGSTTAASKTSDVGSTWTASQYRKYYISCIIGDLGNFGRYFIYKRALYLVCWNKLYINGAQGLAASGTSNTLTISGTPWTTDQWKGAVLRIFGGTGDKAGSWTIASNTNNTLTIDSTFWVTPDATTEFVIVGSNWWTEITGHGLSSVFDVVVCNGHAYFFQGDSTDIRRMRAYNSSGTWTYAYAAETGLRGAYGKVQDDGSTKRIWWAPLWTNSVSYVSAVAEGSALGTATSITVGDTHTLVTGLEMYGEDSSIWVFKEDAIYEMEYASGSFTPVKFKQEEIASVADYRNGFAHLQHNVYLYFSVHDTLQRYYNSTLDSIGPDLGAGLPPLQAGNVNFLLGYPGQLLATVDGTRYGIYSNNGRGWHNLFAAYLGDTSHERCFHAIIQTIPGDQIDRLWFMQGPYPMWIPVAIDPAKTVYKDYGFYAYRWEAHVISSWFYVQMTDVEKFWYSVKLVSENLSSTCKIAVEYQVDNETDWHSLGEYTTSFFQEKQFSSSYNVTGRRLRLRWRLQTLNNRYTPKLIGSVIEAITRVQFKYQTSLTFRLADNERDLNGQPDPMTRAQKSAYLKAWAAQAAPVQVSAISDEFNSRWALVEPASYQVLSKLPATADQEETDICQIALLEL